MLNLNVVLKNLPPNNFPTFDQSKGNGVKNSAHFFLFLSFFFLSFSLSTVLLFFFASIQPRRQVA